MKKTSVLLYSGGTDSYLINKIWKPDLLLYVDMKTRYSQEELRRIDMLGRPDNLIIHELPLGRFEDKETAFIPQRNMYLLMTAAHYGDTICLGATKEDEGGSSDKSVDFLVEAERLLNRMWEPQSLYAGKEIQIIRFNDWTKDDLIKKYIEQGGDIDAFKKETFSCYTPVEDKECLSCKACFRKFVACYSNGAQYAKEELEKVYEFTEQNVVHRSHHARGRYFLEKENARETLEAIQKLYKELGKELSLT